VIPDLAAAVHTLDVTIANVQAIKSGQVEVSVDDIRQVANKPLPGAETEIERARSSFKNLTLDKGAFGHSPLGRELAHQHQAAHDVFRETIDGVLADLRDFRQNLVDCMNDVESTDESARSMLLALGTRYHGHTYNAEAKYDQGLHQHAGGLTTSNTDAQPQPAAATPDHATTPAPSADEPPAAPVSGGGAFS